MLCKAEGRLAHHFHGKYWASMVLVFESSSMASAAMTKLPGWVLGKRPEVLAWSGYSEALDVEKERLGGFGADISKIDSVTKSIDYGEPFFIAVECVDPRRITASSPLSTKST